MDDTFVTALVTVTLATFALSFFGLAPTARLRRTAVTHRISLLHILCLPMILAAIFAFLEWLFPPGDDADQMQYALAFSAVAIFWWYRTSLRMGSVRRGAITKGAYLTTTVLFAYLSPALNCMYVMLLTMDNVRPPPPKSPLVIGLTASATLFCIVFLTTWYVTIGRSLKKIDGEPENCTGATGSVVR
jgi:hypothetical protein